MTLEILIRTIITEMIDKALKPIRKELEALQNEKAKD